MTALNWLALALLLAVLVAGPWYAIRNGIRTFKQAMRTLETLGDAVGDALGRLDAAPGHLDDAAAAGARLSAALGRLQRSRARLSLLLAALSEVRSGIGGVLGVVPRR